MVEFANSYEPILVNDGMHFKRVRKLSGMPLRFSVGCG